MQSSKLVSAFAMGLLYLCEDLRGPPRSLTSLAGTLLARKKHGERIIARKALIILSVDDVRLAVLGELRHAALELQPSGVVVACLCC